MNWKSISELPELIQREGWPFEENAKPLLVWVAESGPALGNARRYRNERIKFTASGFSGDWTITHWCEIEPPKEGVA